MTADDDVCAVRRYVGVVVEYVLADGVDATRTEDYTNFYSRAPSA